MIRNCIIEVWNGTRTRLCSRHPDRIFFEGVKAISRLLIRKEDVLGAYREADAQLHLHASEPSQEVHVGLADFPAGEGEFAQIDALILPLCLNGGGRIVRSGDRQRLDGVLSPNSFGLAAPASTAEGHWPASQLLSIGLSGTQVRRLEENSLCVDRIAHLGSQIHRDPLIASLMVAIWREAETYGSTGVFADHASDLLVRRLADLVDVAAPVPTAPLNGVRLRRVLEFIAEHLSEPVRVDDLAAIAGMSRAHFSRAFKAATGASPYAYLAARRIDHAAEMLRAGADVLSAAHAIGFSNPSQFAASFKRYKGLSPSAWRAAE